MLAIGPYLEQLDKPQKSPSERLLKPLRSCRHVAVTGECPAGKWQKILVCGREWCPHCGRKDSERHMQRYARWLPRVQQVMSAGYWVVTVPKSHRDALRWPSELTRVRGIVKRVLKAEGFSRGVMRWHFAGDKHPEAWHPHLNVLVPGGKLSKDRLESTKSALREALDWPEAVIHYSYRSGPARLCHVARYITRPTWGGGPEWETEVAERMHGWRNDCWFGRWDGPTLWSLTGDGEVGELVELEKGICPCCRERIRWGQAKAFAPGGEEIAPGYWFTPWSWRERHDE